MTWIALADTREKRFSLRGLGSDKKPKPVLEDVPDQVMTRGSLVFETRIAPDARPKVLLGYNHVTPYQRSLTFQAIPGGGIALVQVQGQNVAHAALQHVSSSRALILRVTYSWDAARNWARMTVERPEEHAITTTLVDGPRPMELADLRGMIMSTRAGDIANDVLFVALSDQVEPVGPMPSLTPETPIATPWGYKPVGTLQRGDTVYTRDGSIVPVLHRVDRSVPARGSFAPVVLRAPYFGLQQDIIVSPEQRLVLDGSEVEYLFSEEAVLVPARHLVNGFAARYQTPPSVITYAQVILPGHETLLAAGGSLDSLYIGRMRRKPEMLSASLLTDLDRHALPEHGQSALKVLKWFEAVQLACRRVA